MMARMRMMRFIRVPRDFVSGSTLEEPRVALGDLGLELLLPPGLLIEIAQENDNTITQLQIVWRSLPIRDLEEELQHVEL